MSFTREQYLEMADRIERRITEVTRAAMPYVPDAVIVDSAQAMILVRMLRFAADALTPTADGLRKKAVNETYEAMGRKCEEMCGRNCPEDRSCEETIVSLRQRIADLEASQPPPEALRADLSNHHNAAECPYCRPKLDAEIRRTRELIESRDAQTEALRALSQKAETLKLAAMAIVRRFVGFSESKQRFKCGACGSERGEHGRLHRDGCDIYSLHAACDELDALSASPAPHTERTE